MKDFKWFICSSRKMLQLAISMLTLYLD